MMVCLTYNRSNHCDHVFVLTSSEMEVTVFGGVLFLSPYNFQNRSAIMLEIVPLNLGPNWTKITRSLGIKP